MSQEIDNSVSYSEDVNRLEMKHTLNTSGSISHDSKKKTPYKGYEVGPDKSIWIRFTAPLVGEIRFNPVVSFLSIIIIWAFVVWCIILKENVPFRAWKVWIVDNFTWLYIGSQDIWALFAVYLYFSKYSCIKLGKPDDKPEYNDSTWFMMLFACGIGVGLFFFGVAEPIYHYIGPNRYQADPTVPDNTLAQIAINLTFYHWGIHGWIVYSLVGMLLGMMSFREGLPLTMKSCFYPIIGDRIYGWMGDVIDIVSVITTLFGVCTSLGLGVRQLNTGLHIMNSDVTNDSILIQVILIWCITAVATVSTASGIGIGIRRLSETCFIFGLFIMTVVLFMDKTFYILNLFTQSVGYYFQWLIQLGFHCDAFELLGPSHGAADRGRAIPEGFSNEDGSYGDGPEWWMNAWTMFYWGWWISWCPFVGMFIAKISKGRTIRQFINGTMTAPILYSFVWFSIFGGIGLRIEREAAGAELCCPSKNEIWFKNVMNISTFLSDNNINLDDKLHNNSLTWICEENASCGPCAMKVFASKIKAKASYRDIVQEYFEFKNDFGSVSKDRQLVRLSCHSTEQMWFDVMRSYGVFGTFLSIFSIISIVLYFVTSSDSGSLVIDCLTANGDPEPPTIQRVFWALTEGATATALIIAGGKKGLQALQTAGIVSGLPFTVLVCIICVSIWRAVKVASGELDPKGVQFAIGLFDPFGARPYKDKSSENGFSMSWLFVRWLQHIVTAPWIAAKYAARVNNSNKSWAYVIPFISFFVLFIILIILEVIWPGASAFGWFFYLCFASCLTALRVQVRDKKSINGNVVEDFFASLIFYPNSSLQIALTLDETLLNSEKSHQDHLNDVQIGMNEEQQLDKNIFKKDKLEHCNQGFNSN